MMTNGEAFLQDQISFHHVFFHPMIPRNGCQTKQSPVSMPKESASLDRQTH